MKYFMFHLGDFAQATSHLTLSEEGIYMRLLRRYYSEEKPLPGDVKECQRIVNARTPVEKRSVQKVLNEFFELRRDQFFHARCEREIAKFKEKSEKAKSSAEARWKGKLPKNEAGQNPCERIAKAMLTKNQEPINQESSVVPNSNAVDNLTTQRAFKEKVYELFKHFQIEVRPIDVGKLLKESLENIEKACQEARRTRAKGKLNSAYVLAILKRWAEDEKASQKAWYETDSGIAAKGLELGIPRKPEEIPITHLYRIKKFLLENKMPIPEALLKEDR